MPTEADLAQKLNCAVGTLRKALADLEGKKILERIQGSGTYVRKIDDPGGIYALFHLELNDGVGLPTAELLDLSRRTPPDFVPKFGDTTNKDYNRVRRLRRLGDKPAALEEIWFDSRHAPALEKNEISESLHLFYREKLGFWIADVEDRVSVGQFPDWAPGHGGFRAGKNCGFVSRISWSNHGLVEEYSRTWFDASIVHYNARWR